LLAHPGIPLPKQRRYAINKNAENQLEFDLKQQSPGSPFLDAGRYSSSALDLPPPR
jgi:hypothetical protein